jgi:methylase of polypeptide subunit release factors
MVKAQKSRRSIPHRGTQLRLFFSVDIVGGTAYKARTGTADPWARNSWPNRFEDLFQEFTSSFKSRVVSARAKGPAAVLYPPELWKINGDELLFTELVHADLDQRHAALGTSLRTFVELVHETDERYVGEGLGVRAAVWTAGFPMRNKRLQFIQGGIELMRANAGRTDPETGPGRSVPVTVQDYIGQDMDLGFRLAANSPPGRIVCSLDLAEYALRIPPPSGLAVWLVGWADLKGILDNKPYPLFWLEGKEPVRLRHPWDGWPGGHTTPETAEFLREGSAPITIEKFDALAKRMRKLSAGQLIVPYASLDEMPEDHARGYEERSGRKPARELSAERDEQDLEAVDFAVSPAHAETITLDDLNQLLLWLQDHPSRAAELAELLGAITSDPSYAKWREVRQFEGDLFRLHDGLAFASDEKRYLLETFLVKNDALRVKVNRRGEQVFITDGLWVDPSIRAFPFSDESDLILRACEEEGWSDWATCVIDPGTGCGHNLLRYRGGRDEVRRFGFDRNSRALVYAGINALLNGVGGTSLANGDVREEIPRVFTQQGPERVLVLANMPFALGPDEDQIARSAQGGRHGYELTLNLIDALRNLALDLNGASELRCVILAYSVGSADRDGWVVPEYAAQRLVGTTKWRLWEDEKLWRVNGKKEQVNPMPLDLLKLKADCRFYVRDQVGREELREGYEQLAAALAEEGHSHLAYGVLTARVDLRR